MIASLIVGYFADGLYQFLFLFVVGVIIPMPSNHPLIKTDGVGIRMTVDLGAPVDGGMKYALENIAQIPFVTMVLIFTVCVFAYLIYLHVRSRKDPSVKGMNVWLFDAYCAACVACISFCSNAMATNSSLMKLRKAPVATALLIVALCLVMHYLLKTKLGQDFRSVGQSQHIAQASGIDVDRTRIIATMISTVLAAWGMIIFLQNTGTLSTYSSHTQIGMFSVASLLVGGASTSRASIKNAIVGVVLFNAMFIMSQEIGILIFGSPGAGEYFRTFLVYGIIGLALGLYVWRSNKEEQSKSEL
jgi:simple sugar transport system permease protein